MSVATGLNWPNALTGGTLGSVVLADPTDALTDPNAGLTPGVVDALKARAHDIGVVQMRGGSDVVPSVVGFEAQQAAATL